MSPRPIRPARLAGLVIVIVGSLVLVGSIRAAPLPGLGASTDGWFREVGPAEGLLAALRLMVLAGLLYLLAVTMLMLLSVLLRSRALDRLAARCTGPALQRFLPRRSVSASGR